VVNVHIRGRRPRATIVGTLPGARGRVTVAACHDAGAVAAEYVLAAGSMRNKTSKSRGDAESLPGVAGRLAGDCDPVREEVAVIGAIVNWRANGKASE
jgi:hypothetical protein